MQIEQFLENSAQHFPEKTALVFGKRRLTYSEIDLQCNRLAHALIDGGIQRGDRVAVYLDNSIETVISVFAILKAGAVFLVVNSTTKADKVNYILNNCRATGLVTHANKLQELSSCWAETPHLKSVWLAGDRQKAEASSPPVGKRTEWFDEVVNRLGACSPPAKRCIDIDLAALIYTSGSTGKPKGVMLTHLNILSAATSITTYLENTAEDIILSVLPLSFDYGLYQVLMAFKMGASIVLERSFTYPAAVLELIAREKITGFPIVPTISAILLGMNLEKYDFSTLRYLTNTAAALPTEHIRRMRQLFPHVKIYSMYGLTECKRVSYLPPDQIDIRPTSIGRGMPNEEVYIVDDRGERVGAGIVGELVIRGANVMKGYWELPEATDKMLKPGPLPGEKALYSGDLFYADEEGFLYFVGRKDDIIKTRGEKVSPREVEDVLYKHPAIAEVAVFGVPDAVLGNAIKAVIVKREGSLLTTQDVLHHCSKNLEDFMVPKHVEFAESLPKTTTGKIAKRELSAGVAL